MIAPAARFFCSILLLTACGASASGPSETSSASEAAPRVGSNLRSCGSARQPSESSCTCESDDDCADRPGGVCVSTPWRGGYPVGPDYIDQRCQYHACTADVDCGEGRACLRDDNIAALQIARCVSVSCAADTDCQREDGAQGHCRRLSTDAHRYTPEIHCVYPDGECDPEGGRSCSVADACVFEAGDAVCRRTPGPVP